MSSLPPITGTVTSTPQHKEIAKGRHVTRFHVHVQTVIDTEDEKGVENDYHTVVAWGALALDAAALQRGDRVTVNGRVIHRSYTGRHGEKRYVTEIVADSIEHVPAPTT